MGRLLRPLIDLRTKLVVVLKQLRIPLDVARIRADEAKAKRQTGKELDANLFLLACERGCSVSDFNLDHDPALENREKVFKKGVHVGYVPDANDPEHLFYRPHAPQFAGSHKIKTFVRGDRGQYSDAARARKNKRILKNRDKTRTKKKIPQRKASSWPKGRKIPSRKFGW